MKKFILFLSLLGVSVLTHAQYFQHVYYSSPKNEDEWLNHGLRDTTLADTAISYSDLCYAATGIFKDEIVAGTAYDRVRYLTTNKIGTPITNVHYKVYSTDTISEYNAYSNFMEKIPNGYIMVGTVYGTEEDSIPINGGADLLILSVADNGTVNFVRRVDFGYAEEGMCIKQISNGDYIICGTKRRSATGSDAIVLRITNYGTIVWSHCFNFYTSYENSMARAYHLVIDESDNAYITGSFKNSSQSDVDLLFFGVTSAGNLLEHYVIGDSEHDEIGNSVNLTQNAGEFVVAGEVHELGRKRADGLIFLIDPSAATISNYNYIHSWKVDPDSYTSLVFQDVQERIDPVSSDQTFYTTGVVGDAAHGGNDAVVFRFDPSLNPIGEYHYGENNNDFANAIDLINHNAPGDGFVIFGGYGNTSPAKTYSYIVKADFNGETACNDTIQDSIYTNMDYQLTETDTVIFDGDTIINLIAISALHYDSLICQDTILNEEKRTGVIVDEAENYFIHAYPNPMGEAQDLFIDYYMKESADVSIIIRDIAGRQVMGRLLQLERGYNQIRLEELAHQPSGTYFVEVYLNNRREVLKIIR